MNKAKTGRFSGSIGGAATKWTRDKIRKAAAEYPTIEQFTKSNPSATQAAIRYGMRAELGLKTRDEVLKETKKAVIMFNLDGTFEKMFESVSSAGRYFGDIGHSGNITSCCRDRIRQSHDHLWRYATREDLRRIASGETISYGKPLPKPFNRGKEVLQIDPRTGKIVAKHKNATIAIRLFGSGIYSVLCGQTKTAHGFVWRYAEEEAP